MKPAAHPSGLPSLVTSLTVTLTAFYIACQDIAVSAFDNHTLLYQNAIY